jgi:Kelch motif
MNLRIPLFLLLLGLASLPAAAPVAPPAGSIATQRDRFANQWALAPAEPGRRRQLLVLPAQDATRWIAPAVPGLGAGDWRSIRVDDDGFLWLRGGTHTVRFDLHHPQAGLVEGPAPAAEPQPASAWRVAAHMPATNHDLTAAVLNGRMYVSGGLTAEWGFPARSHPFDELWELNPARWTWRVAAKLARDRIYCATAAFDGQVWVIGGDVIEATGERRAVTTVERYDPRTGRIAPGPDTQVARPMPVAMATGGRLYVIGNARGASDQPGAMESLGAGETAWRREPDGPAGMGPLAGAELDGALYVVIPKTGVAAFDTTARQWAIVPSPTIPRSCQMAAYRGELWLMGGRDTANGAAAAARAFVGRSGGGA